MLANTARAQQPFDFKPIANIRLLLYKASQIKSSQVKPSQVSLNARRRAQCKGGGGKEKSMYVHTNGMLYKAFAFMILGPIEALPEAHQLEEQHSFRNGQGLGQRNSSVDCASNFVKGFEQGELECMVACVR